jgi:transcriptional regulator with XRE-family HTH domain
MISAMIRQGGAEQMDFGEQIKQLRTEQNLTQEQFADQLHVTRQAVSNWENNRNLPDLEMLIQMSRVFGISLDQLIIGGDNMTQKLIQDTSETRRAKMNMISTVVGSVMILLGFFCFLIKGMSVEYVDETGLLHENFFLIGFGWLFLLTGAVIIASTFITYLVKKHH